MRRNLEPLSWRIYWYTCVSIVLSKLIKEEYNSPRITPSTGQKACIIGGAAYKADILKNVTFPCQISNKYDKSSLNTKFKSKRINEYKFWLPIQKKKTFVMNTGSSTCHQQVYVIIDISHMLCASVEFWNLLCVN